MITDKAPLSSSLLMLPREFPSYLSTAYSLKYGNETTQPEDSFFKRIHTTIKRYFSLIKELYQYRPRTSDFNKNIQKLDVDFQKIHQRIGQNTKPLCAYLVSSYDSNGAILGDQLYNYHHYKINNFAKHYAVAPKVVRSQSEIKNFLWSLKACNPNREIKVVDIVAHGSKSLIAIHHPSSSEEETFIKPANLENAAFKDCAPDATIILDACSTGFGHHNIADELARKNPGKTIFAPGRALYFSKPAISTKDNHPKIEHVTHGFALLNAYTYKKFYYAHAMPTQLPYTKDENVYNDALKLLSYRPLYTNWFDSLVDLTAQQEKNKVVAVFNSLSHETQNLIKYEIWKNHNRPLDRGDDFGGDFLRANPVDKTVLAAFRTISSDIKKDVLNENLRHSGLIKAGLFAVDVFLVIKKRLQKLLAYFQRPAAQNNALRT